MSEDGMDGFRHRLDHIQDNEKHAIHYQEAITNFFEECATESEVNELFEKATGEINLQLNHITAGCADQKPIFEKGSEKKFAVGMLMRIILSVLIEADRRDTAEFMNGIIYPKQIEDMSHVWSKQINYMEQKLTALMKTDTPINRARTKISDQCKRFAQNHSGIYRLSVPTGSGKTLVSLRYALEHARQHNKKRIVLITPLLAVIEQNEKVIREYIEDTNLILTHHSNVSISSYEDSETMNRYEVLAENWLSPIVITTLVQFLNTLFLGKTTAIRRMAALSDCVIVIDEIQSVPGNMISLVNCALNYLAYCCKSTILLCSATQPVFEQVAHPLHLSQPCDIIPYEIDLWKAFQRTQTVDMTTEKGFSYDEVVEFSLETMKDRTIRSLTQKFLLIPI